jgi:hypothetical protein
VTQSGKIDADVRFGSLADIDERLTDVRFTPESGHHKPLWGCPLCAINGREQLKRGRCADQGDRDQSTLMFAARMTLAHFSVVSVRSLA